MAARRATYFTSAEKEILDNEGKHEIPLKGFRFKVALGSLLKGRKRRRPSSEHLIKVPKRRIRNPLKPLVNIAVRNYSIRHFPIFTKKERRRNCPKG
ncbi:hypothetical protein HHI36_013546 [Cryptolaemus montrouzieri]|uniref:Uncharacterized protein n=1 Tax=Cryptolaemus montrouzieri TaxID=559131 RepID=A0ABD2NIF3_9CUCU